MPNPQELQLEIDDLTTNLASVQQQLQDAIDYNTVQINALKSQPAPSTGVWASGEVDRTLSASSSVTTIAHGLGVIPAYFRLNGLGIMSGAGQQFMGSIGTYNGTTMSYISVSSSPGQSWGTGYVMYFSDGTNACTATVTWDKTNVYIQWTKVASGIAVTVHCIWEAFS
jgi:hypothetical protein